MNKNNSVIILLLKILVIHLDRYVILGNHVDAWVFGGVDPSSGTSVMMEIARVVGDKVKAGNEKTFL